MKNRIMFWFVDPNMFNVDEMAKNASTDLRKAAERKVSSDDMRLMREAYIHVYVLPFNDVVIVI
jgi:hypothetical protein